MKNNCELKTANCEGECVPLAATACAATPSIADAEKLCIHKFKSKVVFQHLPLNLRFFNKIAGCFPSLFRPEGWLGKRRCKNRTFSAAIIILLIFSVFILCGCFAKVIETNYYQLDYVPSPKSMTRESPYPYTLRIKDFDVSEAYRRNNIVYRQSPYELHFYNYEQWAVKPEYLVSDMLFAHFNAAKIFTRVKRGIDSEEPDFIVAGTIRALEEYDNQDEWYAHLAMNMNLTDNRNKQVLWSREWNYRKKVSNLEPIFVVRGLSELLERINNEAIADIDSVLNEIANGTAESNDLSTTAPAVHAIPFRYPSEGENPDSSVLEKLPPPEGIE